MRKNIREYGIDFAETVRVVHDPNVVITLIETTRRPAGEVPLSAEEKVASCLPTRDFEQFRCWQDQHASPEQIQIAASEEHRRQWHERHDVK